MAENRPPHQIDATGIRQQEGFTAGLGQRAHTQNVALAFGHRNHAACIQKVEDVGSLDALVISGKHAFMETLVISSFSVPRRVFSAPRLFIARRTGGQKSLAFLFRIDEMAMQHFRIGEFEVVAGIFLLGLKEKHRRRRFFPRLRDR